MTGVSPSRAALTVIRSMITTSGVGCHAGAVRAGARSPGCVMLSLHEASRNPALSRARRDVRHCGRGNFVCELDGAFMALSSRGVREACRTQTGSGEP